MVFLVGGANTLTAGYDIDNSLRMNNPDNAYLYRTVTSGGSSTTATWSCWVKKNGATNPSIFTWHDTDVNDDNGFMVLQWNSDKLYMGAWSAGYKTTTAYQRDQSAWYHIVVAFDSTQAVALNRVKLYINGEEITDLSQSTTNIATEDFAFPFNATTDTLWIGTEYWTTSHRNWWDGYIADVYWIDGTALTPSSFGETDEDSGIWKPKAASVTFGTNGFHLEFKNSAVGTGASDTIGADTSGNDNHFTSSGVATTDQTTDTPTNNFCTLNPLDVYASKTGTYSEGNTKLTVTTSDACTAASTMAPTSGKWYWEVELDATDGSNPSNLGISDLTRDTRANMPSKLAWGYGYNASTGDKQNSGTNVSYGDSYTAGDILGVAMDLDNGAVYFSKGGTFQASGDPTSGASKTNAAYTWTPDGSMNWSPYVADNTSGVSFTWLANFGNPAFAISSSNADANGYGNFEYAPPSGYYALCSKNLAEFG